MDANKKCKKSEKDALKGTIPRYSPIRVSGTAAKLSELAENDQSLSLILENLLAFVDDLEKRVPGPRYFETKEMNPLGEKITEIVDTCRGKKGKIAREVIKLITE